MPSFLIDVNLPYYFSLWNNAGFIHQKDINDEWSDEKIWIYAKENNLTIISKNSDFSNKMIISSPPPKVIHIRFGNMKINQFYNAIFKVWDDVLELNAGHKLVNVFQDRIEGIQ
jgi:predicted nuclease of predicted toxin-antitoxin system